MFTSFYESIYSFMFRMKNIICLYLVLCQRKECVSFDTFLYIVFSMSPYLLIMLFQHFVCAKCEKPFHGHRHYEKKGLAYCEQHYHQLFGNLCYVCNQVIAGDGGFCSFRSILNALTPFLLTCKRYLYINILPFPLNI